MNLETFRDRIAELEAIGRAHDIAEAVLERRCEMEAAAKTVVSVGPFERLDFLIEVRHARRSSPEFDELRALRKRMDEIGDDLSGAFMTGGLRRALTAVMLNYPATHAIELLEETP